MKNTFTFFDPMQTSQNFDTLIRIARIYFNCGFDTTATKVNGQQKKYFATGIVVAQFIKYFLLDETRLSAAHIRHVTIFKTKILYV